MRARYFPTCFFATGNILDITTPSANIQDGSAEGGLHRSFLDESKLLNTGPLAMGTPAHSIRGKKHTSHFNTNLAIC